VLLELDARGRESVERALAGGGGRRGRRCERQVVERSRPLSSWGGSRSDAITWTSLPSAASTARCTAASTPETNVNFATQAPPRPVRDDERTAAKGSCRPIEEPHSTSSPEDDRPDARRELRDHSASSPVDAGRVRRSRSWPPKRPSSAAVHRPSPSTMQGPVVRSGDCSRISPSRDPRRDIGHEK